MALTKEQKKEVIEKLKQDIAKQKAMVFVSVKGLKNQDLFDLRNQLKELGCLLTVAKKTLLEIAFKENNINIKKNDLEGQVALISGFEDEVAPAKTSYNFSLKNENLKIVGGYFNKTFINIEEVINLAKIPNKQELLAKVVGSLSAPISGLTNVLQGNIKGLINILGKIKA